MPKQLGTLTAGTNGDTIEIPIKTPYQSRFSSSLVFKIADKDHAGYPSNAVTLITDGIIQIMCYDGKEAANTDTNRKNYGNNRHIYSNLLQWLNSSADNGAWYSAKHSADAPPNASTYSGSGNYYEDWAGFLAMLPLEFVNAIMTTTRTVALNTVTDGGGSETFTTKMFLANCPEVGFANENGIAEGTLLALFSENTNACRLAYPTDACLANSNGYTNSNYGAGKGWRYWLQTPYASNSYIVRYVLNTGALNGDSAFNGYGGVRPLCNLSSEILVSDNVNANGNYELVFKLPPTIPSSLTVPSTIYKGATAGISWGASIDPDGDTVSYELERSKNGGSFTQIYSGANMNYTDNITADMDTLQYRVRAVNTSNSASSYATSAVITVLSAQPPNISGVDENLGSMTSGFSYGYTITHPQNKPTTVQEILNGEVIKTYAAALGVQAQAVVDGVNWLKLTNGSHTLQITAKDSEENTVTRTLTFTKAVTRLSIEPENALEADTMPRVISISITPPPQVASGAILKVETCNNGNDPIPTWEDATNAYLSGYAYIFKNIEKVADKWGIKIRASITRNGAVGECYLSGGIEGGFE